MLKKMMKRLKKEEKGFTLIELLAVIVILAVIAVIAVPLIGKIINNTKADSDVATARQVYDAAKLYITGEQNGDFAGANPSDADTIGREVTLSELTTKGYLAPDTVLPSDKQPLIDGTKVVFNEDGTVNSITLKTSTTADAGVSVTELKDGKATR
ncbi:type II secretion system protein [Paenibacillus glycanilyticus]|uniref:type II secretion system protein n=1 Tax=Paenibacillus glycanilyticus TaxID=126569 RepID=UPI00191088C7|nr:type II secretion system protein [Paenibacillus glycanilyticus]